jgi:hypothetical protein
METPNSTVHDDSVWKRRVTGKLVFKFQKPLGVAGAPCTNFLGNEIVSLFILKFQAFPAFWVII